MIPQGRSLEDLRLKSFPADIMLTPGFKAYNPDPDLAKSEQKAPDINTLLGYGQGGYIPIIPSKRANAAYAQPALEMAKLLDNMQSKWGGGVKPQSTGATQQFAGAHRSARPSPESKYYRIPAQVIFKDWECLNRLERVGGYTFRGDTRDPEAMMRTDGFQSAAMRDDGDYRARVLKAFEDYFAARYGTKPDAAGYSRDAFGQMLSASKQTGADMNAIAANPQYGFLGLFITFREMMERSRIGIKAHVTENKLNLSNYVSTSRSALTAKYFVRTGGWVYATLVPFGLAVPVTGSEADVDKVAAFNEQEVVSPGSLGWQNICAYRKVKGAMFTGPVYLRQDALGVDREAMERVFNLLCGERQSNARGSKI